MSQKDFTQRKSKSFTQQAGSVASFKDQGVQVETQQYAQKQHKDNISEPQMEQQKQQQQQQQQQQSRKPDFPKIQKPSGECLMFVRGKKEYVQRLKNAFTIEKRVVQNYGGSYVGLADDIIRSEGDLYRGLPEACIVIIRFKTMDGAERWIHCSPIFKQADFPTPADELEYFAIPMNYLPEEEVTSFQLTELYGLMVPPDEFEEKYVNPVVKKLNSRRIYHGLLATHKVNRLRNCMLRPDTYILLHCADSLDKLKSFYDSSDYACFRQYRQEHIAENDTCFFSVKPVLS